MSGTIIARLPLPDLSLLKLPRSWPWPVIAIPSFLIYTLLCNSLRMQRRNAMQRKFGYTTRESFSKMTNVDAQQIMKYLAELEFPRIYVSSIQFALFKVLIPRIITNVVASNPYIRLMASPPYVCNSPLGLYSRGY
jgi:hypothetical protein